MKVLVRISFILITAAGFGQSIDDVIMLSSITRAHKTEKEILDEIEVNQRNIALITRGLGYTAARYTIVERRLHQKLIFVHDVLNNAQKIYQITKLAKEVVNVQDEIYNISQENPDLIPLAADGEVVILKRMTSGMMQFLVSTIESKFNLMDNKQRLEILDDVISVFREALKDSISLRSTLRLVLSTNQSYIEGLILEIDLDPYYDMGTEPIFNN